MEAGYSIRHGFPASARQTPTQHPLSPMTRRSLFGLPTWIVAAFFAAPFYIGAVRYFYVGAFNDDAAYVVGALSLLKGHYQALFLADAPPMTLYPPGYPLF